LIKFVFDQYFSLVFINAPSHLLTAHFDAYKPSLLTVHFDAYQPPHLPSYTRLPIAAESPYLLLVVCACVCVWGGGTV